MLSHICFSWPRSTSLAPVAERVSEGADRTKRRSAINQGRKNWLGWTSRAHLCLFLSSPWLQTRVLNMVPTSHLPSPVVPEGRPISPEALDQYLWTDLSGLVQKSTPEPITLSRKWEKTMMIGFGSCILPIIEEQGTDY